MILPFIILDKKEVKAAVIPENILAAESKQDDETLLLKSGAEKTDSASVDIFEAKYLALKDKTEEDETEEDKPEEVKKPEDKSDKDIIEKERFARELLAGEL